MAEVEALACRIYPWRLRQVYDDAESYWVTGRRAGALLGVSPSRLDQLATADRLPYVVHADGTRKYRRDRLETIGNARSS